MTKVIDVKDLVNSIEDGSTIATVGMTLISAAETILTEIENQFLEKNSPRDLTLVHAAGQGDRVRGIIHLAHEGLLKRIIGSHWGLQPAMMELITNEKIEAYCIPQGQICQLYRSMSRGISGHLSKTGLGTFVDPRLEGGKMNERTKKLDDISKIVNVNGEEYIWYNEIPLDYVILRGTECDENGNVTIEDEAMKLEMLPAALAAKRFGGKVIVQVKRVVQNGTLNPKDVVVPGVFIDNIVVCDDVFKNHRQTSSWYHDPSYSGQARVPVAHDEVLPLDVRKMIGRRAVYEISKGDIINLGTGIPNDVISHIVNEEGFTDDVMITVESGMYGGIGAGGIDFGIAKNTQAMITHTDQMDFYNGTGVDVTFIGFGECDKAGNVNSTKMGNISPGAGGLIDIAQGAKKVVFCGTFTAKGLKVNFDDRKLNIVNEGEVLKFVDNVKQVSLSSKEALKKDQKIVIVTERAVFELRENGMELVEIAPGIDVEKDILALMKYKPLVSDNLKVMDADIFNADSKANIKQYIK